MVRRSDTPEKPPVSKAAGGRAGSDPAAADAASRRVEMRYRVAGVSIAICLGVASAIWEALLTPLHVTAGGTVVRLPIAPLVAIIGNLVIFWFGRIVTGRIGLAMLPAVGWLAVMVVAGSRTSEGDLLIAGNNWVGIVTILLGALAWAAGALIAVIRSAPGEDHGGTLIRSMPGRRDRGTGR